jgi:hypothetical protein
MQLTHYVLEKARLSNRLRVSDIAVSANMLASAQILSILRCRVLSKMTKHKQRHSV